MIIVNMATTTDGLNLIKNFFETDNIVIIGATGDKSKLGWHIVENFLLNFEGKIYFVNPKGGEIEGYPVYKNVLEIQDPIKTAVIAIPAKFVQASVEECVQKGIKSIIVESGGFAEVGEEGKIMQDKLVEIIKSQNARMIGPNCIGVLSPSNGIDTIFIPRGRVARPGEGKIAMMTQSGALGSAVLDAFTLESDGRWISRFCSYGNAADVGEFDLLQYFGNDDKTKIILAHLEGFKDGKNFMELARTITREKPIVVLKTGRTKLGAKASESHSGSVAVNDDVVTALLKQHGIVRVDKFKELIQLAKAFATQPVPTGPKVGIVTDGGGFAVIGSDVIEKEGLELGTLNKKTIDNMKANYPSYYISNNPLDLTGTVTAEQLMYGIEQFALDPNIDVIVTIIIPSAPQLDIQDFLDRMTHFITNVKNINEETRRKPIFSISLGGEESKIIDAKFERLDIPTFETVEDAMRIIRYLVEYRRYLNRVR
jgi:acetate---CoA ligase (ADP-forming)